jgi:hypothetical protein
MSRSGLFSITSVYLALLVLAFVATEPYLIPSDAPRKFIEPWAAPRTPFFLRFAEFRRGSSLEMFGWAGRPDAQILWDRINRAKLTQVSLMRQKELKWASRGPTD